MRVSIKREIPNHGVSEDVESTGSHCSVKLMGDEVTRGDIRALPHICRSLTDLTLEITDKDKMCYRYVSLTAAFLPLLQNQQGVKTYC